MKTNETVMEDLNRVFQKVFRDRSLVVNAETTAADIRDWDSLTHMHLINEIEIFFDCEFSLAEVVEFKNVGDIVTAIQMKKQ